MSLADLNKVQKQYMVLGAVVSVMMVVLIYFGVKFSTSSLSEMKSELEELTQKIDQSDRTLAKRAGTSLEYEQSVEILKAHLGNTPPRRNYYSWATEIIYAIARSTGLEVDAIDETGGVVPQKKAKKSSDGVKMESYALRITAHGGYECAKQFLRELQHEQPLVRISGIGINKGANPEVHDIQLSIEWPYNISELTAGWMHIEKMKTEAGMRSLQKNVPAQEAKPAEASDINGINANKLESRLENKSQESQTAGHALAGRRAGGKQ